MFLFHLFHDVPLRRSYSGSLREGNGPDFNVFYFICSTAFHDVPVPRVPRFKTDYSNMFNETTWNKLNRNTLKTK